MPLVIVTLVVAAVSGLLAPRRVALAVTAVAVALTLFAFVWTVTDGVGNDPAWIILVAVVGGGAALALADALSRVRARRVSA